MTPRTTVHGLHAIRMLLQRDPKRLLKLFAARGRSDAAGEALVALASTAGCAVERVEKPRLDALCGGAVHQGFVAEVRPLAPWTEDELIAALPSQPAPLLLALDGVQDPHNLGACLRTADACGAMAVIIPKDRAAPLNATARKVAAGAAETTPTVMVTNLARCLRDLKEAGLWVFGADAQAADLVADVGLDGPLVLVLGGEGGGLRQLTRQHCDRLVRLPQVGAVESLNVSVAAGMLLYEAVRQRGWGRGQRPVTAGAWT